MKLEELNQFILNLEAAPGRDNLFALAFGLVDFLGLEMPKEGRERLLVWNKQGLKDWLAPHPLTHQPQYYRMNEKGAPILIHMGVMDKVRKDRLVQLIDKEGVLSYQATPSMLKDRPAAASYLLHFATTSKYDRLHVVLHQSEQKRVLTFRRKLSQTQFQKILPLWEKIGLKSKAEIQNTLWKSLDLKEVNKEFYKQIKERFDALLGIAAQQFPEGKPEEVKQFAVRLIGRYIFCWFLKEKEIIPAGLLESKAIQDHPHSFFNLYLKHLFFNTLNEEVANRTPLATSSNLDEFFQNIPYLNGGLFDEHPEDFLFQHLDLNPWLLEFVKILEGFDFTVDESSSQYQFVAIDPEMLGRIFENLLASQNKETEKLANDRKAFGAFYTPREIVDYMVNESLKAHLENHILPKPMQENILAEPVPTYGGPLFADLPIAKAPAPSPKSYEADIERKREKLQKAIDKLFSPDCTYNPFDKEDTPAVRETLSSIKILDPACGSGAFPMGVLLRLMELRQLVGHGHRNSYDLKAEILSRNIFGVDIMPMAVEIARLRAWLSLVLEADHKPKDRKNNFGIAALPNLDFKFVCANSLVDSGYDGFLAKVNDQMTTATLHRLQGEIEKLEKLREQYFDPKGDKGKKKQLQDQFLETKNYIKTEFVSLKRTWKLGDFLDKVDDWNPFHDGKASSFFSPGWMFGINEGFDVVIGNPPYVQIQGMRAEEKAILQEQKFKSFVLTGDLYCLFYERGFSHLKDKGIETFITSSQWTKAGYGQSLRKFLSAQNSKVLLSMGPGIFESATVDTNILIAQKGQNNNEFEGKEIKDVSELNSILDLVPMPNVNEEAWTILNPLNQSIKQKIKTKGKPLRDWDVAVYRGILTGFNEAFILDEAKRNELVSQDPKCAEIIRPILKGREIQKYWTTWEGEFVIATFPAFKLKIESYLPVSNYLNSFQPKLNQTGESYQNSDGGIEKTRKKTSNKWFETQDQIGFYKEFEKEKIIWKRIGSSLRFSYSDSEIYSLDSTCFTTGEKIKYLTALLNSKLCQYYLFENSPRTGMGDLIISVQALEPLPVYYPNFEEEKEVVDRVDQIIEAKKQDSKADTSHYEKEIDSLVFGFYGLTEEEIVVVDPGFEQRIFSI